jgi:hypothetical protein
MFPYHTVTGNTALCITANFPANVSVGSVATYAAHAKIYRCPHRPRKMG